MYNIDLLIFSLEFIEKHLNEDLKTIAIAKACHCSKSTLEKLFQCINNISVHGYVVRRRMMLSARKIVENPNKSILSIALEYGYSSNESFTRAFKEIWNCTPSEFRDKKFTELFPQLREPIRKGDNYIMQRKNVDISQLYDLFNQRKDCYFICCDIKSLIPINNISFKAGDLAIIEMMNRMNNAAGPDDMVFRIGGDEFCILTNDTSIEYANSIAEEILKHNQETFQYENKQIPLTLYAVTTKFKGTTLKYDELFTELHMAIKDCKAIN